MATISPLTEGVQLTPVRKRRSRISYSPVKTPKATPSLSHSKSMTFPQSKNETPTAQYDLPTASLEFEEFSFWGDDGSLHTSNVSKEHLKALHGYLIRNYGASQFLYCEPFLVIGCEGDIPAEDKRPFSVAGLISIWRNADDMKFTGHIGHCGEGDEIEIHPDMLERLVPREIPSQEVILYLADYVFKDCEALTILWETLVVELPKVDEKTHLDRLDNLPGGIDRCGVDVRYYNGPLPNTESRKRVTTPMPKIKDSDCDETDYVALDGKFYPGTMLNSLDKQREIYSSVTAGVLVEKGHKQRLTCSFHNWEEHNKAHPRTFGHSTTKSQRLFEVTQGKPGTRVRFVRERIGGTDIALAQLDEGVVFENSFMEMDYSAKAFVHSIDQSYTDEYMIDSFTTGKQKLRGNGRRFQVKRRPGERHYHLRAIQGKEELLPPDEVSYIELQQGACVTNDPVMYRKPYIREGVCGAVLLRCKDGKRKGMSQAEVMACGDICGMMHFADLQATNTSQADNYICYADAFDPLIEDGWKIVKVSEEEEGEEEEKEAESGSDLEESPTKKQKKGKGPNESEVPKKGGKKGGRRRGGGGGRGAAK
jgi:hypothetical protein